MLGKGHRHLSLAMALATAWMWGFPLFGVLQGALRLTPETASLFSFCFLVGNVLGYCAYAADFTRDRRTALATASPLINTSLMIVLLLYSKAGPIPQLLAPALALVMGIVSAALTLMWATTVSERPPGKRGRYVAAMLLIASLIHSVILAAANLSPELAYLFTATLMVGCWRLAHSGALDHPNADVKMRRPSEGRRLSLYTFWLLFACLLTGYYSLSWMSHLGIFSTTPGVGGLAPIAAGLAYGGVALIAGTVVDRTGEIEGVAMVGLAILISTFIFAPIADLAFLDFFLQSSYGILDVFVFTYLAQAAGRFGGRTYRFYACGLAANAIVVASGYAWIPSADLALSAPTNALVSLLKAGSLVIGSVSIMMLRRLRLSLQKDAQQERPGTPKEQLNVAFDAAGFTDRERDVAHLIFRGYSNQDITDELQITINTLKTHIRHIYSKTDSSNRTDFILKVSGPYAGE